MTTSPFLPGVKVAVPASSPALVLMGTVTVVLDLARAGTARRVRVSAAVVRLRRMGFFSWDTCRDKDTAMFMVAC